MASPDRTEAENARDLREVLLMLRDFRFWRGEFQRLHAYEKSRIEELAGDSLAYLRARREAAELAESASGAALSICNLYMNHALSLAHDLLAGIAGNSSNCTAVPPTESAETVDERGAEGKGLFSEATIGRRSEQVSVLLRSIVRINELETQLVREARRLAAAMVHSEEFRDISAEIARCEVNWEEAFLSLCELEGISPGYDPR